MRASLGIFLQLALCCSAESPFGFQVGDIKHFVVLFMENRGFDHMFGCATKELPGIDGVTDGMGNWVDPDDHSKGFVKVECGKAQYACSGGEDHSFTGTTTQIFGPGKTSGAKAPYPNATMGGFASDKVTSMHAFAPEQLPVKIKLAQEFAIFNNFYSAMPGPSQPNHMFSQSATSCGCTETGCVYEECGGILPLFPQKTIYESLLEAKKDFRIFTNGSLEEGGLPGDIYMTGLLKNVVGRAHTFDDKDGFYESAAKGTLPELSWVLPRNGGAHPNDDHPCHDVALGEELLKTVYETLRAGPNWNNTALFVVYDDHGGWFDHVPTPLYAPPPNTACDKKNTGCPNKFAFDRLGPRLANLFISPRLPKGMVIRDPQGPTNTSKYNLASIPATVKNLFGLQDFLTDRDAWSGSFHENFLAEPRTDTPMHLPDAPPPSQNVNQIHGCGSPDKATRRQVRHKSLLDSILSLGVDGHEPDEDGDDEDRSIPFLGDKSFLVTKGVPAMMKVIGKKVSKLFTSVQDGSFNFEKINEPIQEL